MKKQKKLLINKYAHLPVIGWREWVSLPLIGIDKIKAKIDTGAKTSALHAFALYPFVERGKERIRFDIHPIQKNNRHIVTCVADIVDQRYVTDSGGHREKRYVIETAIQLGELIWPIQITLTNRDNMSFRMLIGRTAIHHLLVNPSASFLLGKKS